jgi:hypothetical protein
MAFTFGLGADTMLGQFQRDATQFKLVDISGNIQKYNTQVGSSDTYVDYTFSHLNRFMQQDQENDTNTTYLFEYQALLRARMQQLITDLTAALTRDLDTSMNQARSIWNTTNTLGPRQSAQGYSSDVEDAGAGRIAYNFFTGFANGATAAASGLGPDDTATPLIEGVGYTGIPTYDPRTGGMVYKVSPDTSIDALFSGVNPANGSTGGILRVAGTGTIQQAFPQDGLTQAVLDNLVISHRANNVLYQETGGGFSAQSNSYKFTDVEGNRFDPLNIGFLNVSMADNGDAGNLNDTRWDSTVTGTDPSTGYPLQEYYSEAYAAMGSPPNPTQAQLDRLSHATPDYQRFNEVGNVKNEFQRVLYDTIFELDQRGLLRDIFRLSEKNGFLNDVQIASTSSINTGTQVQASILLNFVPGSATRTDLGGRIQVITDRFSAFYHS